MKKQRQSVTLDKAIKRLEGLKEVNHEFMDADDLGDLETTIEELNKIKDRAIFHEYKKQIKSFLDYMADSIDTGNTARFEEYTQTPFLITHGNKKVTVDCCAEVHEHIEGLLKAHLSEIE